MATKFRKIGLAVVCCAGCNVLSALINEKLPVGNTVGLFVGVASRLCPRLSHVFCVLLVLFVSFGFVFFLLYFAFVVCFVFC